MRIQLNKKDVEKLFDNNELDIIEDLLKITYPVSIAKGIVNFIEEGKGKKSTESLKKYLINSVMKGIRSYNRDEDIENFEPYLEKRKLFRKKMHGVLTPEEDTYLTVFSKDIKGFKKDLRGRISKKAYESLKSIYEDNKEDTYTLIHRTGYEVDPIFEDGIRFGSSTEIYDMCQRMDNFHFMLEAISLCNNYKYSSGCFIIKIPKKAITEKTESIFYKKEDILYLNPKYVVAYAPVSGNKVLTVEENKEAKDIESEYYVDEKVPGVLSSTYLKM